MAYGGVVVVYFSPGARVAVIWRYWSVSDSAQYLDASKDAGVGQDVAGILDVRHGERKAPRGDFSLKRVLSTVAWVESMGAVGGTSWN